MKDNEITRALDGADVFLRNRANSEPAPLNEYDVEALIDIANVCDEATNLINRLQAKVDFMTEQRDTYMQEATELSQKVDSLESEIESKNDLIHRQSDVISEQKEKLEKLYAEIEEHKNNCDRCGAKTRACIESLQNDISEKQAELERLNKQLAFEIESAYDRGTKAAVKEFAEELKKEAWSGYIMTGDSMCPANCLVTDADIDKMLKKRVGEG